jgi:hypothetical protein
MINSCNEWDPLEKIIVGSATNAISRCYRLQRRIAPTNKPIVKE